MRIVSVVGNRPQFIKSAPLSSALGEAGIEEVVVHTGQHYDPELSQVFYDELGLGEPRYRLETRSSDPEAMIPGIREAIAAEDPDWLLLFGDTNSTLAGARAAGKTPIAHVEAGLRSFDDSMAEERTRIEVDRLAALLLCPDERSLHQLESEAVRGHTQVVGDVMADANRLFRPIALERSRIAAEWGLETGGFVLVTIHRAANTLPDRLQRILQGLERLDEPVVFPAHPRTRAALGRLPRHRLTLREPVGYLDFAALLALARVIVTDSGGVQKEAYWNRVPCVTLRPSTEWLDTVELGANVLVDDDPDALVTAVSSASFPTDAPALYGDGHASGRIAEALYAWRP